MRNKMAKIIVLGSHAESLVNFRKDMLREMARRNQVIACVPDASVAIITELETMGIEYRNVHLARTGLNPFADLATVVELYKLCKQLQPDQIFSYTIKPVIFGSIAAKLAGVKQIYSMITGLGSYFIHTDLKSTLVKYLMILLYKIAMSFNTKVFFQNPDDIADFARLKIFNDPKRTVMVNGSGVNLDYFSPIALPTGKISFLLIARFIQAKGLREYLAAAKLLKQQYPQLNFYLVGWTDNKDEALSAEFIQEYIDDGIVENLGKLADVRPALALSSVYVLPSYREGTPKSVLEAMASGRAIITTDVPGCRETVQHGDNGLLVPARDVAALRAAMEKFIIEPALIVQMGQRSREIAVNKYDVRKVNQAILLAMGYGV
jgi:glycosyltransferase involved in cell wall biosynthesis